MYNNILPILTCLIFHRISLFSNGTLKIANVTKRDAASYTCVAKNQFGSASTSGRLIITGRSHLLPTMHYNIHKNLFSWSAHLKHVDPRTDPELKHHVSLFSKSPVFYQKYLPPKGEYSIATIKFFSCPELTITNSKFCVFTAK